MEKNQFDSLINQIIDGADIVQIIGSFIPLKKHGSEYLAVCPFHQDTNPSLHVSTKKKIFKCFVCKKGGNVITFVQLFKKVPFLKAAEEVARLSGLEHLAKQLTQSSSSYINPLFKRIIDANEQANIWYQKFLRDQTNQDKLDYLIKRFKDKQVLVDFGIGYATKQNQQDYIYRILTNKDNILGENVSEDTIFNDKELDDAGLINIFDDSIKDVMINRIIFPIHNASGNLVGFSGRSITNDPAKYLNTRETKLFKKNQLLYNFHRAKQACVDNLIITEGFADTIAYHQSNLPFVVSLMGTVLSTYHLALINRQLPSCSTIVLSLDNDQAGIESTMQIGQQLLAKSINVEIVDYDSITQKDPDEIFQTYGSSKLQEIYNNRLDFISWMIKKTLSTSLSAPALKKQVEHILKLMVEFNDLTVLDRSRHLNEITKQTNIPINDLQTKLDLLVNKSNRISYIPKPPKTTLTHLPEDQLTIEYINGLVDIYNKLIIFLLANNHFIANPKLSEDILNYDIDDSIRPHIKIIKAMKLFINKNHEISCEQLLQLLTDNRDQARDQKTHDDYQQALNLVNNYIINKTYTPSPHIEKSIEFNNLLAAVIEQIYEVRNKKIDEEDSDENKYEKKDKLIAWYYSKIKKQ